jgi:hypothetical protein
MASLADVSTPSRIAGDRFRLEVPDGWQQGRGAFGGLVLASLTRAIEAVCGSETLKLRTLTAEICAPVLPGQADARIELLREGSGTVTAAARLEQAGAVVAHTVAVLGRDRVRDTDAPPPRRPTMRPFGDVKPIDFGGMGPPFANHFEYRPTGAPPLSGVVEGGASGWVRARDAGAPRDAGYLVAMADAWWPALFSRLDRLRPLATITFTLDLVGSCDGLAPDAPLYHHADLLASSAGYAPELRTLWTEDGRLLTINHQTFVVIR